MRMCTASLFSCLFGVLCAGPISAADQGVERAVADTGARMARERQGAEIFKAHCSSCHEPAVNRAPDTAQLEARSAEQIERALKDGLMQPMAAGLSDADIGAVAAYLALDRLRRP